MSPLPGRRRLFRFPWSPKGDAPSDVASELDFHLDMRIAELRALGHTESEARDEALRRFGNLAEARSTLTRDAERQAGRSRTAAWFQDFGRDAWFGLRGLRRRPAFAGLAVATIGLGLGLTTAVLAIVNRLVLDPLPYPEAGRLAVVWLGAPGTGIQISPTLEMQSAWQDGSAGFEWAYAHQSEQLLLEGDGIAELVPTRSVSPALLPALGARFMAGRRLAPADALPGAPPVALLSWGAWRTRFGASPDAIGRTVRLEGKTVTIVGVVAKGFDLTALDGDERAEFWLPLDTSRPGQSVSVVLLRRAGAGLEAVTRELGARLEAAGQPRLLYDKFGPIAKAPSEFASESRARSLWLLTVAVALLLGVACANVAALLLSQAATRAQELGVRSALGAGRGRVARQLVTEAAVLGGLGGLLGLGLAVAALGLTRVVRPANLLQLDDATLPPPVLLVSLSLTFVVALLFGAAPAWAGSRADASAALAGRSRRSFDSRFARLLRSGLVVGQLAASLVLLSGAGLLVRGFLHERNLPLGFEPAGLGWIRLAVSRQDVPVPAVREALIAEAHTAVAAVPGIEQVALTADPPLGHGVMESEFLIEGQPLPGEPVKSLMPIRMIGAEYFTTVGMPLVAGRAPDARPGSAEVVVDRETARRLWPGGSAVGSRIRFNRDAGVWHTVVGIAPEQRALIGAFEDAPFLYTPLDPGRGETLVLRWRGEVPLERASAAIRAVDPRIRVRSAVTATGALDERLGPRSFTMAVVAGFALLALLLAAVGLYGVIALMVSQRNYELGVRIALGAAPGAVARMVLREGAIRIGAGLLLGSLLAAGLGTVVRSLSADVGSLNAGVWAGAALLLLGTGLLACWAPARRAARVDPLTTLRAGG